jgi:hypothetical protein
LEGRLGQEGQGGRGAEQQVVGQALALALDVEAVQGGEDAAPVMQGEEPVEGAAGGGGGRVGSLPLPQRLQDRLAAPPIPDTFDGLLPPLFYSPILPPASLISSCLAMRFLS